MRSILKISSVVSDFLFSSSLKLFLSHFRFYVAIFVNCVSSEEKAGAVWSGIIEGDILRNRVLFDFCWLSLSLLLLLLLILFGWCCCCCCRHFCFFFYIKVVCALVISFSFVLFVYHRRTKKMGLWLLPLPLIYVFLIPLTIFDLFTEWTNFPEHCSFSIHTHIYSVSCVHIQEFWYTHW